MTTVRAIPDRLRASMDVAGAQAVINAAARIIAKKFPNRIDQTLRDIAKLVYKTREMIQENIEE